FDVKGASGRLVVGQAIEAALQPFQGAGGKETAMHDTIFTTIPGSPAFVGKASVYRAKAPTFDGALVGHNAVSGHFRFTASCNRLGAAARRLYFRGEARMLTMSRRPLSRRTLLVALIGVMVAAAWWSLVAPSVVGAAGHSHHHPGSAGGGISVTQIGFF